MERVSLAHRAGKPLPFGHDAPHVRPFEYLCACCAGSAENPQTGAVRIELSIAVRANRTSTRDPRGAA